MKVSFSLTAIVLNFLLFSCGGGKLDPIDPALEGMENCYQETLADSATLSSDDSTMLHDTYISIKGDFQEKYNKEKEAEDSFFMSPDEDLYNKSIECYSTLEGCVPTNMQSKMENCSP
ncbi:hypothetical protein ACFL5V_10355 [Fibrobacterota bacterium]